MSKRTNFFKENLTVPNLLSVIRLIVIVPLIMALLNQRYIDAGICLLISGLSDMFDGAIARKFNQVTQLGKMLDPVADKLTLIAVLVCIAIMFPQVAVVVIILLLKDVIMLIGGAVLLCLKIRPPAAKWYGKVATAIFYTSIILIIFLKAVFHYENYILTVVLLLLTALAMVVAFISYGLIFIRLIKDRKSKDNREEKK